MWFIDTKSHYGTISSTEEEEEEEPAPAEAVPVVEKETSVQEQVVEGTSERI